MGDYGRAREVTGSEWLWVVTDGYGTLREVVGRVKKVILRSRGSIDLYGTQRSVTYGFGRLREVMEGYGRLRVVTGSYASLRGVITTTGSVRGEEGCNAWSVKSSWLEASEFGVSKKRVRG